MMIHQMKQGTVNTTVCGTSADTTTDKNAYYFMYEIAEKNFDWDVCEECAKGAMSHPIGSGQPFERPFVVEGEGPERQLVPLYMLEDIEKVVSIALRPETRWERFKRWWCCR